MYTLALNNLSFRKLILVSSILLCLFLTNFVPKADAAVTSWMSPSAIGEAAYSCYTGSYTSWTNHANVYTSNNSYASITVPGSSANKSYGFQITGFGFSIPAGSRIDGVEANVEGYRPSTDNYSLIASIQKNGFGIQNSSCSYPIYSATGWDASELVRTFGGPTDLSWGVASGMVGYPLTAAQVNMSDFGLALWVSPIPNAGTFNIDHVQMRVYYTAPPTASGIAASYGSYARTGSVNTPWTLNFTGAGGTTNYQVRTGSTSTTGTQVITGVASDGVNAKSIAYNATGIVDGSQTLYLYLSPDNTFWSPNYSFTLLRDDVAPTSSTSISTTPASPTTTTYSVTFTPNDVLSTSANEIRFGVWTGAGGTGSLLTNGTATSTTPITTSSFTDAALVSGANTRYVRACDGANNCTDTSFTVTANFASAPTVTTPTSASITGSSATLGGNITSAGTQAITARGVCYSVTSTNANPQSGGTGVTCTPEGGTATGVFTQNITSLSPTTGYSYKAYSTNSVGTGYTSAATFTTLTNAPISLAATLRSNLGSYKVTFNGTANPNGSQAYGYFRLYTSVPDCTLNAGGARMPNLSGQDFNLGSGNSPVAFNYTTPPTVLLTANTPYWYCAYARNTAAGDLAPGTTIAGGYQAFTTLDGGASGCDAPASGDLTVVESCTFPQSDYDGVDAGGSSTTNTAKIILNTGGNITLTPGQVIGRGSLQTNGGSFTIGNGTASFRRAGVWLKDTDGDQVIDSPIVKTVSSTQPTGYIRRNHIYTFPTYNTTSFNFASKMYNAASTQPNYVDCDSTNGNIYQNIANMVADADQDGYKTVAAGATQCVGSTSTINGRTYYKNATNAYTWLSTAQQLGGGATDCQDNPTGAPCAPVNGSGTNGTNPTATAATTTQINLGWGVNSSGGAVPGLTGYDVQICGLNDTTCASVDSTVGVSSATVSYNNSGITCSTSPAYYYRIVAKHSTNGNTNSNIFSGVTSTCSTPPSTPTNFTATVVSAGQVNLSWTASSTGTAPINYVVQRCLNNLCTAVDYTNVGTATTFSDTSLTCNQYYGYAVYATNAGGNSAATVTLYRLTSACPSQATGVTATTSSPNATNNVAWSSAANANLYDLVWCTGSACTPTTTISLGNVTSYSHTGLTCGAIYRYYVIAKNAGGSAVASATVQATVTAGTNNTCYRDADNDTYTPASPATTQQCASPGVCSSGWINAPSGTADCYDSQALAYPGSTNGGLGFEGTRGDGSGDFNCDGTTTYTITNQAYCTLQNFGIAVLATCEAYPCVAATGVVANVACGGKVINSAAGIISGSQTDSNCVVDNGPLDYYSRTGAIGACY